MLGQKAAALIDHVSLPPDPTVPKAVQGLQIQLRPHSSLAYRMPEKFAQVWKCNGKKQNHSEEKTDSQIAL